MLRIKKNARIIFLAALGLTASGLSGCHVIGAHGSLHLGSSGHGHGYYHARPAYGHYHRPSRHHRPARHSHSSGRHYRR